MKLGKIFTSLASGVALFAVAAPAQAAVYQYDAWAYDWNDCCFDIGDTTFLIDTDATTLTIINDYYNAVINAADLDDFDPTPSVLNNTPNYFGESITGTYTLDGVEYDLYWSSDPECGDFVLGDTDTFIFSYGVDEFGNVIEVDIGTDWLGEATLLDSSSSGSSSGDTSTTTSGGSTTTSGDTSTTTTSGGSTTTSGDTSTTTTSGGSTTTSGDTSTTTTSGGGGTSSSGPTTSSGGTEIPEPGTLGIMGLGLAMMAFGARTRRRKFARG